ncbi:hypothetical protein NG774_11860 [Aliarcobacter cryaerophilus]|uniref:hypothetical protein n=1 Tax=Aliarcobacter cryaerophilus TaxID=28198 RepID=UPI003DA27520
MYKHITLEILATFKRKIIPILKTLLLPIILLLALTPMANDWIYVNLFEYSLYTKIHAETI